MRTSAIYLTPDLLKRVYTWHNEHGRPWTPFGYEKIQTPRTNYLYAIRRNIGWLLHTEGAYSRILEFLWRELGIDYEGHLTDPSISIQVSKKWDHLSHQERVDWFRRNAFEAAELNLGILADAFAWHTGPDMTSGPSCM